MLRSEALDRLASAEYAHLATITPEGEPHIVAVTFVVVGDTLATMVDHKLKTTQRLQRVVNVERNPKASLLVDHYSDDWSTLWWVRVDGPATVHYNDEYWRKAGDALVAKYAQYTEDRPEGPAIRLAIERVSSWESTP